MGGGFSCYDVWDAHIGAKEGPKVVFDTVKPKLMLLSYFCLDRFLKFGEKWLFSYFYSIFKHNKRFLHNIMIFQIDL